MKRLLFVLAAVTAMNSVAMEWETLRVNTWRRGESIAGDDFIAQTEAVVDYLASLRHPTGTFETIRYNCQVKGRVIRPSVTESGASQPINRYVQIVTIYDIKDCVELKD